MWRPVLFLISAPLIILLKTVPDSIWSKAQCRFLATKCAPAFQPELTTSFFPRPTLVDHPIVADNSAFYLDGKTWQATLTKGGPAWLAAKGPLPATVPGDIITDLQNAGVVDDPFFNVTWRDPKFIETWNSGVWSYTRRFPTSPAMLHASETLLVFDGIRMGATITLNGAFLGNVTDQFLRQEFHVGNNLLRVSRNSEPPEATDNVLTVTFHKDIQCGGRYTYSNQIDWAPNFVTFDPNQPDEDAQHIVGRETFGFGIWKSVYLVPVKSAAILQFVSHTFYAGGHPTSMLTDGDHAGFEVRVRIIIWAPTGTSGQVKLNLLNVTQTSRDVNLIAGVNNVTLTIPASDTVGVKLWQPHGHGAQHRYNITANFMPVGSAPGQEIATWRLLGFRHVALVTINDTDAATAQAASSQDGSGTFGMYFRVNGAALYARGGNKIPMDLLDGRLSAENHYRLVRTAVEGNMNMLRVWGGGIWEPRAFFDACDELGLLLYLDMQFTWGEVNTPGAASEKVRQELIYQVQRISHHASIVLLDGCNECGGGGLYESFVMPTVAAVDQSRPIWPASPTGGWLSGVDRLSGRPNGETLAISSVNSIEQHGPYNGLGPNAGHVGEGDRNQRCDATTMPNVGPAQTGPRYKNLFHSEFGCVAWPSFESISAQLPPDQWALHSNAAGFRNWPVDIVIKSFFGEQQNLGAVGEIPFKKQLYQSLLGQALFMKKEIETWRAGNIFGSLFWMYNEIWPTGGWGSVEYGGGTAGQVPGGRWKPFHYFLRSTTFADQLVTCTTSAQCYVKNDSPFEFHGILKGSLMNMLTGSSILLIDRPLTLQAGPGVTEWFCASDQQSVFRQLGQNTLNYIAHTDLNPLEESGTTPLPDPSALAPSPSVCTPFIDTKEWHAIGCDTSSSNCLLTLEVISGTGAAGKIASFNVLPFVPPKEMRLPKAAVTVLQFEEPTVDRVPLKLLSNATALYVTLTTKAAGRFSDNAFLLKPGIELSIDFLPWGTYGAKEHEMFKSSLRVEHLAENL